MPKRHGDLTGRRFEKLAVLSCTVRHGRRRWLCRCDCGTEKDLAQSSLINGKAIDCGCGESERRSLAYRSHGATLNGKKTPTYETWRGMKMRCDMPNNVAYHRYGGRGIQICERWRDYGNFLADMGERPKGMTLDRIDTDGNYEPGNCRWADKHEQSQNRETTRVFQTPEGAMTSADLETRFGVKAKNVGRWARWGWTDAEIYTRAKIGPLARGQRVSSPGSRQPG